MKKFPIQPGDMEITCADIGPLNSLTGYAPATPMKDGLKRFVALYREFHSIE
ncbi:MAG: hypothetical protein IH951_10525 [Bacteroidetes bacterium]|nr:hypothetical protein [Bacteroidota bacterium]